MRAALFNPLTFIFACMCILWVTLGTIGPFAIKLPYLMLAGGILYAVSSARRMTASLQFVRQNAIWILPLVIYLAHLTFVLYGSAGQNMPLRQLFYLLGSCALAGSLAVTRDLPSVVRMGAALALGLFILVVEILARTIGLSWIDALVEFVRSGDLHFVVYKFFREVFNSLEANTDTTVVASQKNGIAVCVLTAALLFRSGSSKPAQDKIGMIVLGLALILLFLLNTRSVLIVAGVSLLMALAIHSVMRPANVSSLVLKGLMAFALVVVAVGYTNLEGPAVGTMSDRMAFEDRSTASRLEQYQVALKKIGDQPVVGNGYFELDGRPIHNLFLSSWVQAGLPAFLLVVAFYLALLGRWLSLVWTIAKTPKRWVIPVAFEWIAPLPILPLFRVWISGDGGHLFLGEWIALSAFFGMVLANDLKRQNVFMRRSVDVGLRPVSPAAVVSPAWRAGAGVGD